MPVHPPFHADHAWIDCKSSIVTHVSGTVKLWKYPSSPYPGPGGSAFTPVYVGMQLEPGDVITMNFFSELQIQVFCRCEHCYYFAGLDENMTTLDPSSRFWMGLVPCDCPVRCPGSGSLCLCESGSCNPAFHEIEFRNANTVYWAWNDIYDYYDWRDYMSPEDYRKYYSKPLRYFLGREHYTPIRRFNRFRNSISTATRG